MATTGVLNEGEEVVIVKDRGRIVLILLIAALLLAVFIAYAYFGSHVTQPPAPGNTDRTHSPSAPTP